MKILRWTEPAALATAALAAAAWLGWCFFLGDIMPTPPGPCLRDCDVLPPRSGDPDLVFYDVYVSEDQCVVYRHRSLTDAGALVYDGADCPELVEAKRKLLTGLKLK